MTELIGVALRDLLPPAGPRISIPTRTMLDLAGLADRLGYHSVWVPEGHGRELFTQLGAIAVTTSQIRLATGILPVFSRLPVMAAMSLATLDDLSTGRVIFGVGTGHRALTEQGYGTKYQLPLIAVQEFIEIVRRVLTGQAVHYRGQVFQVDAFELEFKPARRVPIFVAALGTHMLRVASQVGDGVLLNWATPERVRWAVRHIRAAMAAVGRDPRTIQIACFVRTCVTDDPVRARSTLRRLIATYASLPAYARMWRHSGFAEEVRAIQKAWASGVDAAAASIPDVMGGCLGLVGSAAVCREGLSRFRSAGVDIPIVYPFPTDPGDETALRRTIQALAPASVEA